MDDTANSQPVDNVPPPKSSHTVNIDYRWLIIFGLVLLIVIMTVLWKPWEAKIGAGTRTIDVVGNATVKAVPDEIVFTPQYSFKMDSKQAAVDAASKKNATVTERLKTLGVVDNQIKSNTSGYDSGVTPMAEPSEDSSYTYTTSLTVTLTDTKLAQKVQDYLATTSPEGQVTPYYDFTDETRAKLESDGRNKATADAKKKAEQSAGILGVSVGSLKNYTDNSFGGYPIALRDMSGAEDSVSSSKSSFNLQPGENELNYSVSVSFYVK